MRQPIEITGSRGFFMQVAVVGGTGFVGSYIVDALFAAGHDIRLLVRPGSEDKLPHMGAPEVVPGDLSDESALDALLRGCDAVVYCVGILKEARREGITFETLQYEGVVRTIAGAEKAGATRFVLLSANGARVPGTPYQETKKRAEDALLDSGLDATIFRPSVIFGDPRGRMEIASQLRRDLVAPPLPAVGFFNGLRPARGPVLMTPVHVADVASACVTALENRQTIGRIYELGGPDVLSWTDMVRQVAAAAGKRKWIVPVPIAMMKLAATFLDWLPFFPATRDQLTMLAEGNVCDPATIEALIGRPPAPFNPETLAYLRP
jgi:NADH dehydrogenase